MKSISLSFLVLSIAFVFSGCTKNNNGTSNDASVMFVNACSGTGNIMAKIDGATVANGGLIAYFGTSGYQYVAASTDQNINFYLVYQGTPLCNSTQNFTARDHYSVFAGGLVTGPSFVVTTDDFPTIASGNAAVRFINLSSDSLNETFSIGAEKLDSNVGYTTCSPFSQITATSGVSMNAVDPANSAPTYTAAITNQAFAAGKIYTVMLTGSHAATGSIGVLKLTVINNN